MTDHLDLSLPALPRQPRLRPGLTWALDGDAVVVQGLERAHTFRGQHAGRLLAPLLGAMNGLRGHDELASIAACSPTVLRKVLRQLDIIGALEDLFGDGLIPDTPLSDWYARATAGTGLHSSGRAVVRFLSTQVIHLVGNGRMHDRIAGLLSEHGLAVRTGLVDEASEAALAVVVTSRDDCWQDLTAFDDAMATSGIPWLLVRTDQVGISLGPLFDRRLFPCVGCARLALPAAAGETDRRKAGHTESLLFHEARTELLAASVVAECLALVAGVGSPTAIRQILGIENVEDGITTRTVSPAVDCHRCVSASPTQVSSAATAHVYEYGVAGLPERLHGSRSQYGHYTSTNVMAQAPRRLCVDETELWSTDVSEPRVDRDVGWSRLSSLLNDVYGLRDGSLRRHPPTGGNIGSPRALVWLPESAWGSGKSGLHSYEPHIDALCRIEVPAGARKRLRAAAGNLTCVLQVVDHEPLRSKYGPRAPRIGRLDAGVTFEHLAMVCESRTIDARAAMPQRARDFFEAVPPLSRPVLLSGLIELPDLRSEGT
ncbi:hypothetical protein G6W61_16575 [Streptomyces sp. KAI-26]|uniref:hypothetical protein n=1 Tax=Streptomyces sp. KAI-26 TaxID=1169747 RepID=UPI001587771E|nr:hypothetical protein [Streptomyces sp. KAI-26]NUV87811.1 hypothetical protein [Streptomyces sp. KAI-26]NUW20257.1 hypothetical protein [Streptomyces roseoviolaceus]